MAKFDLEKQLTFYGAYHNNPVNIGIHMACVPVLLLTGIQFGTNTAEFLKLPAALTSRFPSVAKNFPLNMGTLAAITYSALYILLEPVAGLGVTPIVLSFAAISNRLKLTLGARRLTTISASIHTISWLLQFVGHGKYEGRAPALLDNLMQALFLAPLFVWFEVLFALGYRPELKKRLEANIKVELERFRVEKEAKAKGGK